MTAVLIDIERKWSRMSEDLIRRSDAIYALRKLGHEVVVIDKVYSLGVAHEFIDAIRDIPSADIPQKVVAQITFDEEKMREIVKEAVERFKEEYEIEPKRGEWIDDEFIGQYRCSECDYYSVDEFDFCPNCGADMRERKGE